MTACQSHTMHLQWLSQKCSKHLPACYHLWALHAAKGILAELWCCLMQAQGLCIPGFHTSMTHSGAPMARVRACSASRKEATAAP